MKEGALITVRQPAGASFPLFLFGAVACCIFLGAKACGYFKADWAVLVVFSAVWVGLAIYTAPRSISFSLQGSELVLKSLLNERHIPFSADSILSYKSNKDNVTIWSVHHDGGTVYLRTGGKEYALYSNEKSCEKCEMVYCALKEGLKCRTAPFCR